MRIALFCLLAAATLCGQSPSIVADYIEDRSNRVFGCYCEWSSENVLSGREAILAWRIRSGCYGGVDLAGVTVAAVIEGEDTLSRGHPPRKSVLIVDESAPAAQRQAALNLIRRHYADMLGSVVAVYELPVEFTRSPDGASLRAGQYLNLEMRRARPERDAMQGATHWYDPFIAVREATLGTTLRTKYAGGEFSHRWDWSDPGITGYFGMVALPQEEAACAGRSGPQGS